MKPLKGLLLNIIHRYIYCTADSIPLCTFCIQCAEGILGLACSITFSTIQYPVRQYLYTILYGCSSSNQIDKDLRRKHTINKQITIIRVKKVKKTNRD